MKAPPPAPAKSVRCYFALASWLLVCFTAGSLGAVFMPGEWYAALKKPAWQIVNDDVMGGGSTSRLELTFKDFVPTFRGRVLTDVPPLNPAKVIALGFLIADKQDGPFQLEIAWIRASPATP